MSEYQTTAVTLPELAVALRSSYRQTEGDPVGSATRTRRSRDGGGRELNAYIRTVVHTEVNRYHRGVSEDKTAKQWLI